jgi:hypothetical protein
MAVKKGPRGALYSSRGKRITKLSLARAEKAGKHLTEVRTASGRVLRGKRLAERLASRLERAGPPSSAPRRPGAEREIIEAGAEFPRIVTPWSQVQERKIERWQFAVTRAQASGDFERTLKDILGIKAGGSYRVFVAEPGRRRAVHLETNPDRLRDLSDAGMLTGAERRSYPRATVRVAA